jgi:hypothetical protein
LEIVEVKRVEDFGGWGEVADWDGACTVWVLGVGSFDYSLGNERPAVLGLDWE